MKKIFKILFFLNLILLVCFSASAAVELDENYYYDELNGSGYLFAQVDIPCDEFGITVNGEYYPARFKTSQGNFGIALCDLTAKLGVTYNAKAYAKQGNEYIYSADTVIVNTGIISVTPDTLTNEIISSLKAGDVLLLEDGEYDSYCFEINASGSAYDPIVIRSRNKGKAAFKGESKFTVSGDNVIIADLSFDNCLFDVSTEGPVVKFSGCENSRLTNCSFVTCGNIAAATSSLVNISGKARNVRVDNNLFKDSRGLSVTVTCGALATVDTVPQYTLIDHNYFLDIQKVTTALYPSTDGNGFECIQTGQNRESGVQLNTISEYNRFENVEGDSSEIISNKSDGNIFRYNTFVNCPSAPTFRGGNNCSFIGNYLINVSKGLRFFGDNINIAENYFYKSGSIFLDCGVDGVDEGNYLPQTNCTIEENVIVNPLSCVFQAGRYFDTLTLRNLLPENTEIKNNIIYPNGADCLSDYANCEGITYSGNTVSYGVHLADGFTDVSKPLCYDDGIYIPEDTPLVRKGLILLDDMNNWWKSTIETATDSAFLSEPDGEIVSYEKSYEGDPRFTSGEVIDMAYFAGKATYEDGTVEYVPVDAVTFTSSLPSFAEISENKLIIHNEKDEMKSLYITSSYKGKSFSAKIYTYPSKYYNSATGDYFDFNNELPVVQYSSNAAYWNYGNGSAETKTDYLDKRLGITIENLMLPEGDFELSMDITVAKNGDNPMMTEFGFGRRDYSHKQLYTLALYEGGGIYTYGNHARIGEFWGEVKNNEKQTLKISKNGNTVSASLNGNIVSIAKVPDNISGKISFGATKTYLKVENINLYKKNTQQDKLTSIPMQYERIDENVINITFDSIGDNYFYKLYKNGVYNGDTKSGGNFVDITVKKNIPYSYKLEAYDLNGVKQGEGSLYLTLSDSGANDFFKITNVLSRTGSGGSYTKYYTSQNRFLNVGSYPYCDRNWTYSFVADEFRECGFVQTSNADRYNQVFNADEGEGTLCEDWLKFDINRSATVYVITYLTSKHLPWLSEENGWTQELNVIYKTDEEGNQVKDENNKPVIIGNKYFDISDGVETYIYSKHFDTTEGIPVTVTLGGCLTRPSTMYSVVVKPDVLPEHIEVIRKY